MNTHSMPEAGVSTSMPVRSQVLYWPLLALITVILITVASLVWNHEHPFGFNWDEAGYLDEMQMDLSQFHAHGIPGLIKAWLVNDSQRPPAYRIFAFPFAVALGPSPFVLRFVAILIRVLTLALIYFGIRRIGSRAAAAFSVILLVLCPDFIFFGGVFYNEYALYLAAAGMCHFVFRSWNQPAAPLVNCLGLGVFLGIGALSKASFPALAGCFLGMVAFLGLCKRITSPSPQFLLNACVIGALLAAPWWLLNFRSGLGFVGHAMNFSRHAIGHGGVSTACDFLLRFLQEGLGLPMGCLCVALVVAAAIHYFRNPQSWSQNPSSLPMICLLLAPLPTLLLPLATHNQIMYHTSQALILFTSGFALLATNQGWFSSPIRLVVLNVVIAAQLALTLIPVVSRQEYLGKRFAWTNLGQWEQWDWNDFRVLLRSQGLKQPSIAYLGIVDPLNPPEIQYPWLTHHEPSPLVTLLWRLEDGTPEMPSLIAAAETNDVVFIVPELASATPGIEYLQDNRYNTDFADQMSNDSRFEPPMHLRLGRFHPVDAWVFIRKDYHDEHALHSPPAQQLVR